MNRALNMYSDVLTAFKGVSEAEKFNRESKTYMNKIEQMIDNGNKTKDHYNLISKQPKFLGINSF
ncbi:hypothetical protein D3C71_1909360 [compost metagenome]